MLNLDCISPIFRVPLRAVCHNNDSQLPVWRRVVGPPLAERVTHLGRRRGRQVVLFMYLWSIDIDAVLVAMSCFSLLCEEAEIR